MTQAERIINYLQEHTYIDRPTAMLELRIWNLTAVISAMRKEGIDIISEPIAKNRPYVRYRLNGKS